MMSEFHVEVVTIGPVRKHPNADTLSITAINDGYPVIFRTGDFQEGDKAVYLPVESLVPLTDPRFAFLAGKDKPKERERIRAKRLRGIFSMGLLTKADPAWVVGQNVQNDLNITKYEPPEPLGIGGEDIKDPGFFPHYTDIEGLRRFPHLLKEGEEVVITEKLDGVNGRWLWREEQCWVGSHNLFKKENPDNLWWKAALQEQLPEKLKSFPWVGVYGEVYGSVQSLHYGLPAGKVKLALFDAIDTRTRSFYNDAEFEALCKTLGVPRVPVLYRGPWSDALRGLAEGSSTLANHVREGIVIRPVVERFEEALGGRLILKLHGEGYLLK